MENLESLALKYRNGKLLVLDQRLLPRQEQWVECRSPDEMCHIIKTLQVRGAPLIGIAAALSLADYALKGANATEIKSAAEKLSNARPTAVNLRVAMERLTAGDGLSPEVIAKRATDLFHEDILLCQKMCQLGSSLIADGDTILTHCNTGGLVTAGSGTALGAIKAAWQEGKRIHVMVDETRPLLQGARLTCWELQNAGIPFTLICDNMAAALMQQGRINKVMVGSDRIALNGDVANKIGTYGAAVLAHHHNIPFYVVAPYTTVDLSCNSGNEIPIEERESNEVRGFASVGDSENATLWAPEEAPAANPAFDVTPAGLVSAIVLDSGIYSRERLMEGVLSELQPP